MVVSLSLPVVFCGGPMFPCVRYSCSLGGSGFCVAFVVLVLLRVALGLISGETLGVVISAEVAAQILESCLQIAHGGHFASVIPCCGLGRQLVRLSSHLRIPNVLTVTVAGGSGAGGGWGRSGVIVYRRYRVVQVPVVLFC